MDYSTSYQTSTTADPATTAALAGVLLFFFAIFAVWAVIAIIGMWKVFVKAGKPGWAAIVPIYNAYVLFEISGKPGWWLVSIFVPPVFVVLSLLAAISLAEKFGKSAAWGVILLWWLGIGYLILGFGKATYNAAAGSQLPIATSGAPVPAPATVEAAAPAAPAETPPENKQV
jgi:hypothetical protein